MKKQIITATSAAILLLSGFAIQSQAVTKSASANASQLKNAAPAKAQPSVNRNKGKVFTREKGVTGEHKYIVRFSEEPLASYRGNIPGLKATAASLQHVAGKREAAKLNPKSAESKAYLAFLKARHIKMEEAMKNRLSRTLDIKRRYVAAINGMTLSMTQDEAEKLASLPGIAKIERDREDFISTDRGPTFIGADKIWDGSATGLSAKGEGIVIGVLDSGINGDHPSFAATGGDGYVHTNPLGDGVFLGECDPGNADYDPSVVCTNKLIGRYLFIDATPTEPNTEDTDGHGSHTASTAGGNVVDAPVFDAEGNPTGLDLTISGVAPHANIMAFQVCAPSCFASDRVAAVDQMILDGLVDVINHSIGSNTPVTIDPWTDAVDLAFLSARAAGITVANSSGNNGPAASTLGSAGAPWITNSGAFTHDREIQPKFINDFTGGDSAVPDEIQGNSVSGAYGPAAIVYAGDFSNGDPEPAQCLVPFPAGTWTNGEIVVCDRGTIARVQKCINVRDGGAAGCVLTNLDGGAANLANDAHVVPAINISADSGNALKSWLASGSGHMATITSGLNPFGVNPALGNIAADFTSRGPHLGQDYLPISVGSPGVDIYAALANGTEFGFLSGTSMASPHTAGASALLKQVRPDWTDAEVLSALATTANTAAFKEDGVTPADPFDVGGGVIRVDLAAQAGLLLDETIANFEAANPSLGGDPKGLNVAGMVTRNCLISCSWTRTVEATSDGSWSIVTSDPSISVSPANFSLVAGETQSLIISVDSSGFENGTWVHGQVTMMPSGDMPEQHLTLSFIPSSGELPSLIAINAVRDEDSYLVAGIESVDISDLQVSIGGLVSPTETMLSLAGDTDNSSPYDNLADGVYYSLMTVPSGASRLIAYTTDAQSESPDLDIRVGFDVNGNGMPDAEEEVCVSATATAQELCDLGSLEPGNWWVLVQNWQASATSPDDVVLNTALVMGDDGNMFVDAPGAVPELTPFDIRVLWNLPGSTAGQTFFGTITLGADASHPDSIGVIPVTLTRAENDVSYSVSANSAAVGDTLMFSIEVAPNFNPEDRTYSIQTTVPEGFSLINESVSGGGMVSGDQVNWSISQASLLNAQPGYSVTTSNEDPACGIPFANSGSYTDLELFGLLPDTGVTGDTISYSAFSGQNFNFYGNSFVGGLHFTDDGFVYFDSTPGTQPWVNLPIPNSEDPNDLIAILWKDFVVPTPNTTAGSIAGVTLATAGTDLTLIEYDNLESYPGGLGDSIDIEMAIWGFVDDSPSAYEIVVAFDNINSSDTVGTIGLEDSTGATGTQYAFNNIAVTNGMAVCYDLVAPSYEPVMLTYEVTVEASAAGSDVVSVLTDSVNSIGSVAVSHSQTITVEGEAMADYEISFFGPLTRPRPTPVGTNLKVSMLLTESGTQTNEPTLTLNIVSVRGTVVGQLDARMSTRNGGTYVAVIPSPTRPGRYTLEAMVDGEVVGTLPFIISAPAASK